jgi:hypothetical protein
MARDSSGKSCPACSSKAVQFCAVGALTRVAFDLLGEVPTHPLIDEIENGILSSSQVQHLSLPQINDQAGREAIVRMFKNALAH